MKKFISGMGTLFLAIVILLNVIYTANLDAGEHIKISPNSIFYVIGLLVVGVAIYWGTKKINDYLYLNSKSKLRIYLFVGAFLIYLIFMILWTLLVNPGIVGDSIHVANLAQTFYRNNVEEFLPNLTYAGIPLSEYMQAYSQQVSLSFVYSIFFRIIHFDLIHLLRILNVWGNIAIVFALYKITKQLGKHYQTNKVQLFVLILTFITLPILSTFVYGDVPSLALCLFSVYFMMRYTETKKIRYPIFASIFSMVAYMMRMNSLIFVIATVMYLAFCLIEGTTKRGWKQNLLQVAIILAYLVISILPSLLVNDYYLDKYGLDKNKAYPKISYFLMAMEESWRGNGWYNEGIGEPALKNPEIGEEYKQRIKERLTYFSKNIGYTFDFYTKKLASMWAENTYAAVRSNIRNDNDPIEKMNQPVMFYQKVLLILSCFCSILVLIQNRNNLSWELIFLLTIFIGGFAFHILWEAKSRYIIPYVVILVPIASIAIKPLKIKEKLKNREKRSNSI